MIKEDQFYKVWWQEGDQSMEDTHIPHWKRVLKFIPEEDLRSCSVLDFGCNQGGFLRLLYEERPYKEAIGTDLASESIAIANSRKNQLPIRYVLTSNPEQFEHRFDIAFSLAVLYLLPDLEAHARQIKKALKPGGVYYATYADYPSNPSFLRIKEKINTNSAIPMQEYSLDEIAGAFFKEGFKVSIRRMLPVDFVELAQASVWYECVADHLKYAYEQAYIFRLIAPTEN
ncbi:class I SAM-dependent methyltransferase [Paenibacillus sp. ACRRX]|uniref:class I SAM-dependent methyltransferase n=1 Tax=Paenibacillus sp. ACRRX TaxID=2918206 RepID=UPI001EF47DE4|nr:class I SAM-dependent methyltransferase [Paenibacillus sp. ACRRX]MCG7407004.1 class I SAM-dependent methyltransferase [Paenibacillus sp. ACRRX]